MSPSNRGSLMGPRMMPPLGMRPPPRFGRPPMPPGMPPRMPPPHPMYGPLPPRMPGPRPGPLMMRPVGPPPPHFGGPRSRGPPPLMQGPPMMGPRGIPRLPLMRPGLRLLPSQGFIRSPMRPRFPPLNGVNKAKPITNNVKKAIKFEELEMVKPWMTDEIRNEIQKKNKLYAKAKKNKDAKEWEEFKDLRNKVTRMIREAKTEYFAQNPDQTDLYRDDQEYEDNRDENYVTEEEEENQLYYCETCDREFEMENLFITHNATHKTCGIDGCTFSAHPKLVDKHVSMQHRTGLYHKLKNLSTPEDIQKWRAERMKKYPTKGNVEIKVAQEREKQQRGEIILEDHQKTSVKKRQLSGKVKKRRGKKSRRCLKENIVEIAAEELYQGIRPFRGLKNLEYVETEENLISELKTEDISMDIDNISDEDEPKPMKASEPLEIPKICSLVADYGSDSDNEAPDECPIERKTIPEESGSSGAPINQEISPNTWGINQNRREIKISKPERSKPPPVNKVNQEVQKKVFPRRKRASLLERLLSKSIVHERNLICQCIKYIADNNYFDS